MRRQGRAEGEEGREAEVRVGVLLRWATWSSLGLEREGRRGLGEI